MENVLNKLRDVSPLRMGSTGFCVAPQAVARVVSGLPPLQPLASAEALERTTGRWQRLLGF
jgi:hypothetical protein